MNEKKLLAISLATVSLLFATVIISSNVKNPVSTSTADVTQHTINVNNTVFGASELTTTYQQRVFQSLGTDRPTLTYSLAKKDNNNNLVLAPSGKLFNYTQYATYHGRITNIVSVKVTYSGGSLFVQSGIGGDGLVYGDKVALTSGVTYNFTDQPNHMMITNAHLETTITNIQVSYLCSEGGFSVDRLGTKYTCVGNDNVQYVLTRNGSNVSILGQNGTINVTSAGKFTISIASNTIVFSGSVSSDYKTLTVESITGSNASLAKGVYEFNRVYTLDDFEKYVDTGTGYEASQTSVFTASDLRAAYYVDYGGGGNNTWISGSSFQIPTSEDYLNLSTTVKHGGDKSMVLKGSKGGWMRFWSREVFDQSQHYNFGSGNKLSFWVHSAYSNRETTTDYSGNVTLRVQVYYQNFTIDDSNRNSTTYGSGTTDITVSSGSGWTEKTITIDPTKKVYAVNFMINNSGLSSNVYVPVDDISVCTYFSFEPGKTNDETDARITKTYHGTVNMIDGSEYSVKVGLGANGFIYAFAGADMEPTGYTITGNTIVITTSGSISISLVGTKTFGNWTGTLSNNKKTITISKSNISGSIADVISSSQVVLTEDSTLADGSEDNSTLQSIFTRQYRGSSWTDDTSNEDRIIQTSKYYMQGSKAISIRPFASGEARIIINPSLAQSRGVAVTSISFWYYVPSNVKFTMSIFSYDSYTPSTTSYKQAYTVTYEAEGNAVGWHYINMGIAETHNKNVAIYFKTQSTSPYIVDYITYY